MDSKSKIKYSDIPSEDSSQTHSFDSSLDNLEKLAFLPDSENKSDPNKAKFLWRSVSRQISSWTWSSTILTVLPWLLVFVLSLALFVNMRLAKHWYEADVGIEHYTPASLIDHVEYQDVVFKRGFGPEGKYFSEYAGWPSDELDAKWDALYDKGISFIEPESHEHLLNKSVRTPIPGLEDTYMITLDVFHQLHCLNSLRKYFYPSRFNMTFLAPDGHHVDYEKWIHMDHCINSIRQSLMCNADVSTVGYDWFPEINLLRTRLDSVHRCRNWDAIHDWALDHQAPYNGHNSHVDEETGEIVDFGFKPTVDERVHFFEPEDWEYTIEEM